jgi:alginate O-acetyltransferase complex protein AlgI
MLFNSYAFIFVFLPIVLALWWGLKNSLTRLLILTGLSYLFYAWWDWRFLPLLIFSSGVDYIAGERISASGDKQVQKFWLVLSLSVNLGLLGFFKYYDFFATSFDQVASPAWQLPTLGLILPIGISFYTFNSMSYTIDLYRGTVTRAASYTHYAAFVAMFPHLIAGPIVRYADIEARFNQLKLRLSCAEAARGVQFFILGLAKKILIADRIAPMVDSYFTTFDPHSPAMTSWFAMLGYTMQLYFDFSGYSDMAVGLAQLLGIEFPRNFDSPYKATSIADFWRRWHITLSTWLRDYLYIPLGGSEGGSVYTARNLTITMFLGGLWHGAQWTFVVWGLYHGALLAAHRLFSKAGGRIASRPAARLLTLLSVVGGWVIFRSSDLNQAGKIFASMAGANGWSADLPPTSPLLTLIFGLAMTQLAPNTFELNLSPRPRYAYALAGLLVLTVLWMGRTSPFLYFQF